MNRRFLWSLGFLLFTLSASAQPADYYRYPLDLPCLLSANYAEMRPDHFHSGVDLKTGGTTGHPVHAAADGYVARISVAPSGYGRAIYIAHPNGTTTVYAHMERFTDALERYLDEERYRAQRSNIDLFPEASRFPVRQGDVIGLSGNSGWSLGPHVHFEVRRTKDSRTLNPIANGWIRPKDDIPPRIVKLWAVSIDTLLGVPIHGTPRAYAVQQTERGEYTLADSACVPLEGNTYFILESTDRKNDVSNTFGVWRVTARVDGETILEFEKDALLFSNTRYCNASVHYPMQLSSRNELLMLALQSGNHLPMYKKVVDRGVVRAAEGERKQIVIDATDDCGNLSRLSFDAIGAPHSDAPVRPQGVVVPHDRRCSFTLREGCSVTIPAHALYESIFYTQEQLDSCHVKMRSDRIAPLSPVFRIGDPKIPIHNSVAVTLFCDLPDSLQARASLAGVSAGGDLYFAGGRYKEGRVNGSIRSFGRYCVVADTKGPEIAASFRDGADLTNSRSIHFKVHDNFSGIASFSATIDGKWIAFEQDARRGVLTHYFDDRRTPRGQMHRLVLTLRDGAGNKTTWEARFRR